MKIKIIVLILAFITVIGYSQDSIPNQSFENWYTPYFPIQWETINDLLPTGFYACERTTDAFDQNFALKLRTINLDGTYIPGVATLGEIDYYNTTGGVAFSQRPSTLTVYVKHPSDGDEILIGIELFKNGVEIGSGAIQFREEILAYTKITIPINYSQQMDPDTLNITLLTDFSKVGSTLIIDHLEFDYTTPVNNKPLINNLISVYPNPCSDHVLINKEIDGDMHLEIYDLNGKQKLVQKISREYQQINVSQLPLGSYLFIIRSQEEIQKQIIIKQ